MRVDYCSEADLYNLGGLQRGALSNPGRLANMLAASSGNAINLDQHGFVLNDQITLRAEAGGSLPAPLAPATTYYVIPVTGGAFSVAATPSGPAIVFTTVGSRVLVIAAFATLIAGAILFASRVIDQALPAHLVPLTAPIHELVRITAAELAVAHLVPTAGGSSKTLADISDAATKRIEKWGRGQPLRGENRPPPANVATSASVPYRDSRGWNRFGGTS